MAEATFTDWRGEHTALWANQPLRLAHRLHDHPLFGREGLADLIERYPRQHYALVYMGAQGGRLKAMISTLRGSKVKTQ